MTCRGDPEKSDNYGNTALHLAAAKESFSLVSCPSLYQPIKDTESQSRQSENGKGDFSKAR
jgi:hypothetical protein